MVSREEILKRVFKELSRDLLRYVDSIEHLIVLKGYMQMVEPRISDELLDAESIYDDKITMFVELCKSFDSGLLNEDPSFRVGLFKFGPFQDELDYYSCKAFELAKKFYHSQKIAENYPDIQKEVLSNMERLRNIFMEDEEQRYYFDMEKSETLLDLEYACGKSDINSLRMGRYIMFQKSSK